MNFIIVFMLFTANGHAAIFGTDSRERVLAGSDLDRRARATAIAVLSSNFEFNDRGGIDLDTHPMSEMVCADEKFADDPSLNYACTGFLVAPDLLMTAGHCMVNTGESRHQTDTYCQAFSWLFDYRAEKDGVTRVKDLDPDRLYACKEVVYAVREERPPFRDFAIVRLNREVKGRAPLKISMDRLALTDTYSMIGYPFGTPAKFSAGAHLLLNDLKEQSFITNLDAFEGNSGSPVFNSRDEVVGILVGGTPLEALRPVPGRECKRYNICAEDGTNCLLPDADSGSLPEFQATGSIVQRIEAALPFLDIGIDTFVGM